jgi:hypothetical protein
VKRESGTDYVRSLMVVLIKYYSVDQNKKNEMGRVYGSYGGEERCILGYGGKA